MLEYVTDGYRFTLNFFDAIQASVAHIYHSALHFAPKTQLWKMYIAQKSGNEAEVLQGRENQWRSLVRTAQVPNFAMAVEYSRDGNILAVGGKGFSQLFRSLTGERRAELESDHWLVWSVSFSCDNRTLATTYSNSIRLWDIDTGSSIAQLDVNNVGFRLTNAVFHPYIENVLVAGDRSGRGYVWDVKNTSDCETFEVEEGIGDLCWLKIRERKHVLVGCQSGSMEIWNIELSLAQRVRVFSPPQSESWINRAVEAVASSHDGSLVASGSSGGALVIYDTATGVVVHSFQTESLILSVAFSPTEPLLAIGSASHTLRFFYYKCNRMVSLNGHRGLVRSVAFSPDGRFVASGSDDCTINIWKTNDTDPTSVYEHHSREITSAHFSHDGELIVSASHDTTVKVWNARTGALCSAAPLDGHKKAIQGVLILSDNAHVVSADTNGTLMLWDWREGKILGTDVRISCTYGSFASIFPYSHHARTLGFISAHWKNYKTRICCWTIEPLHPGGPRIRRVAYGDVPTQKMIVRIGHRGPVVDEHLTLLVECNTGKQFSASLNILIAAAEPPQELCLMEDTGSPQELRLMADTGLSQELFFVEGAEPPQTLHSVEGAEQSLLKDVPRPLYTWEMPSLQFDSNTWIFNERGQRILWVPPVNRGDGRWHGRRLAIAGESGRLTLVDFSKVDEGKDYF